MPKYDFHCSACESVEEQTCSYDNRHQQVCSDCGSQVEFLFSPTTNINVPQAFKYAYSELFGTTSRKDFEKEHPELEIVSQSRTAKTERKRKADERKKVIEEGKDIERTLIGRGQLKRYDVESGSMKSDV